MIKTIIISGIEHSGTTWISELIRANIQLTGLQVDDKHEFPGATSKVVQRWCGPEDLVVVVRKCCNMWLKSLAREQCDWFYKRHPYLKSEADLIMYWKAFYMTWGFMNHVEKEIVDYEEVLRSPVWWLAELCDIHNLKPKQSTWNLDVTGQVTTPWSEARKQEYIDNYIEGE